MALDKKQIALTVGGIVAGLTLTYMLYRLEQGKSAADTAAADASAQSALATQQFQYASLPSISVPTISSTPATTPSPTDVSNQSQIPAIDPTLAKYLAAALSQDNTHITSQSSPISAITELPFPTQKVIPTVVVPSLIDFSQSQFGSTAQPISATPKHNAGY